MTLVGSAEVLIVPSTVGFEGALKKELAPGLSRAAKDAEVAGAGIGGGLRKGVSSESAKIAEDVELHARGAGDGLSKGIGGGVRKVSAALSEVGVPLGAFNVGLEHAASASEHAHQRSEGLAGSLDHLGGVALAGVAGAAAVTSAVGIHLAESMQSADARIAGAAGTSVKAADQIGSAFLGTAGKTEFSAQALAGAFADVAGQLKATEGHALGAKEALDFMTAASDLAVAKNTDLGSATKALAGIMQTFQLKAKDAAHASDVLYQASNATGTNLNTLATQVEKVHSKLGDVSGSIGDVSTLLVDMTKRGITGRAAMGALNSGLNTLQQSVNGVSTAQQTQKQAFDDMTPSLRRLVSQYDKGTLSSKDFAAATKDLPPQQQQLIKVWKSAADAVATATEKYKSLGVSVFDASGKFVGMRDLIEQLHPRFARMTQQQQLTTAAMLFGAGAARQMTAVIQAGPAAYDAASRAVNKHGAAQTAAAAQAKTLHREEQVLGAEMSDVATRIGVVLIPVITTLVGWFIKATAFVTDHKAALIALGVVVAGVLGPAIAVFTINKMAAFGRSFTEASGHVRKFASDVEGVVSRVIQAFTRQNAASKTMGDVATTQGARASTAAKTTATDTETSSGKVQAANTKAGASFAGEAGAADTAATTIGADETAMAAGVTTADSTIEADNVAAGSSFAALGAAATAILPALGAVGAQIALAKVTGPNKPTGASPSNPAGSLSGAGRQAGGGGGIGGLLNSLGISIPNPFGGETYAQQQANATASSAPALSTKIRTAGDLLAKAASARLTKADLEALWVAAGGNPAQANMAASIALAESGGDPSSTGHNTNGTTDRGLWQINSIHGAQSTYNQLANARAAVQISGNGRNWTPWVTYNRGLERPFLGQPAGPLTAGYGVASAPAYVNPFAHARNIVKGRVDQGVDYGFSGPLGAIGAGVIEAVKNFQGFGTTIEERLTSGARKGQLVYTALENGARLATHAGARVGAGQTIAVGLGTGGIETGFAQGSGSEYGLPISRYGPGQSHNVPTSGGLAFAAFLASIGHQSAGLPGVPSISVPNPIVAEKAALAKQIAEEKAALAAEIAHQKAALAREVAAQKASVAGKGHTPAEKAAVSKQIADEKAALATKIADEKAALALQVSQQKSSLGELTSKQASELKKQTGDAKAGVSTMTKLLADIHGHNLTALKTDLNATHTRSLNHLVRSLDHDHNAALKDLSGRLVTVHKAALAELKKEMAKAAKLAALTSATAALNAGDALIADWAKQASDQIAASTKVDLDRRAEAGLTGAALIAAQAQTNFDVVTAAGTEAIDQAQIGVDNLAGQDSNNPQVAYNQAVAARALAQANSNATVAQAQAQSQLDVANATLAAAQATASNTATIASASATPASVTYDFTILGHGTLTAAEAFADIGWALKTGNLPVAA